MAERYVAGMCVAIPVVLGSLGGASPASGQGVQHGATVPSGYFLEPLAIGFDYPTGVAFAGESLWVTEAGFMPDMPPKVKRVSRQGQVTTILTPDDLPMGAFMGPLIDATYRDGWLWVVHRQMGPNGWAVGAISRFMPDSPAATFVTVITNLPASGDHHSDEIVFDEAGRAYFGQGTATNSSVVGADNWLSTMWLQMYPTFHDFAPVQIVLNGNDYRTVTPFPLDPDASLFTGPYMPFGSGPIAPGTVVPAATPATPQQGIIAGNGTVYSFDSTAADPTSTLRLEAWGLRNPFGVGLDPFSPGTLLVANNGGDVRLVLGTSTRADARPLANDLDDLYVLQVGGDAEFFGFPDFFNDPATGAVLPVTAPVFCDAPPGLPIPCPDFVLDEAFRSTLTPLPALAQFEDHSSADKFDFSTDEGFGSVGDVFVAEFGAFVGETGATEFSGHKVVRVDRDTGVVTDFVVNTGDTPAELFPPDEFNKPIDVKFDGDTMLIVDFGVFEPGLMIMQPGTGKLWTLSPCDVGSIMSFLNAYAAGEPRADANLDGSINVQDFLSFLNTFTAGCP